MRLDKFLKISRLIKRRTVANEACDQGRVKINQKVAKASSEVKVGDILEIQFGERMVKVEVLNISEHVAKGDASNMYKVLES
ncbi:MAG: RNA-binding S4 domain-containing protein [Clostridiaceae bacterium]|nr:RNA-binding S4 domain-containing protein [Clostridiaceae bacterium]